MCDLTCKHGNWAPECTTCLHDVIALRMQELAASQRENEQLRAHNIDYLSRIVALEKLLGGICQQAAWLPMGNGAAIVEMCETALNPSAAGKAHE